MAEFPCAATMPIIAAPFPVNENEGVKKSREVKALPPGIVAALETIFLSASPSLSPLPVLHEYFCFQREYFFGDAELPLRASSSSCEIKLRNNVERLTNKVFNSLSLFLLCYILVIELNFAGFL